MVLSGALRYARLYLSALAFRRLVRSQAALAPTEAVAFGRTVRWAGGGLRARQALDEIVPLLELLRAERPGVVLEVGTDAGGTLLLWTHVASPDALLIALDSRPLGRLGRRSPYAVLFRSLARERQSIELLMPRNSHDPATLDELSLLLAGRDVDFLFIDGDHSWEGVKRDFEMYAPLVRPGGLIALHDIVADAAPGVVRFWQELKAAHATEELVGEESQYGIGLYRAPPLSRRLLACDYAGKRRDGRPRRRAPLSRVRRATL